MWHQQIVVKNFIRYEDREVNFYAYHSNLTDLRIYTEPAGKKTLSS